MRISAFCGTALLLACTVHAGQAPPPNLRDIVNTYINRFVDTSSNIMAEEQIRQEADEPRAQRTIRSDFVVVRFRGRSCTSSATRSRWTVNVYAIARTTVCRSCSTSRPWLR